MKKILYLFSACIIAVAMASCGGSNSASVTSTTENEESAETENEESAENANNDQTWQYTQDVDDLTGNVTQINAILFSNNQVEYHTGNTTKLAIVLQYGAQMTGRLQNTAMLVFVEDEAGLCRINDFQGAGFLASFDGGPIDDTWTLVTLPSKRKSLAIADVQKANSFITKLRQSKTCKIQVNIESIGKKTFEFNTAGLEWNYK